MTFDWTINMGEVLTGAALLLGFIAAHMQNIRKLQDIETRLDMIYNWWVSTVVNRERH